MSSVRAVLGPTNTGKTHLAVERMLAHSSGMIGLPLRLLAREVYDRIVASRGRQAAALVTGEERIIPTNARYFACTVEAMPMSKPVPFLAIDEIQLAGDPDRGHIFTDRILNARGVNETLLLGADTMRPALSALDLKVDAEQRSRMSQLTYTGPIKLTKLPKRSAIVAFSAEEVYAIAELLKRQRGGAAVVMGALSPRTRNAQVELYQSGEVDYIVATDAIGMGLNMDVRHVAFASRRKYDGHKRRLLRADEAAQIAGRAGRFKDDGTFGETSDCHPFDEETVHRIENHTFEPVEKLNWRSSALSFESVEALARSLNKPSPHRRLTRCPDAIDEISLNALRNDIDLMDRISRPEQVRRLWDVCSLPEFRKHGADAHVRLVHAFAEQLVDPDARLPDKWVHDQVVKLDSDSGDIDALQSRLSSIRTWTYIANRDDWLRHPKQWRTRTREIEDRLSDALHERLMQRFVDRRTSALLKRLHSEDDMEAGVDAEGDVVVEGHHVGKLEGLTFNPAVDSQTLEGRAIRQAAFKALKPMIEERLNAICTSEDHTLALSDEGRIIFNDAAIAKIKPGPHWLSPTAELIGAPDADGALRAAAEQRAQRWLTYHVERTLKPIFDLQKSLKAGVLSGLARGVANQIIDSGASIDRRKDEVASALTREDREALKGVGVRTGRIAAYMPGLLKPAQSGLCLRLKALIEDRPVLDPPGSASFRTERGWTNEMLQAAGYIRLGPRGVRADMAERLSWTLGQTRKEANSSAFAVPPEHAALVGAPADDFVEIMKAMGMIPAQRDKETGAVTQWRFASKRSQEKKKQVQQTRAVEDSPFAALAALATPAQSEAPKPKKKKRRKPKKKPNDAAQADATAETQTNDEAPADTAMAAALAQVVVNAPSSETDPTAQDTPAETQENAAPQSDAGEAEHTEPAVDSGDEETTGA